MLELDLGVLRGQRRPEGLALYLKTAACRLGVSGATLPTARQTVTMCSNKPVDTTSSPARS